MPQTIRGVFATIAGLPEAVDRARRALGLTWQDLAQGSPWSRQYLQAHLRSETLQAPVVEHLVDRLNLNPKIKPTSRLLTLQPT